VTKAHVAAHRCCRSREGKEGSSSASNAECSCSKGCWLTRRVGDVCVAVPAGFVGGVCVAVPAGFVGDE
jgi:hypothetical protein